MFRIAVCDNDRADLEQLKAGVEAYLALHGEFGGSCTAFSSPAELERLFQSGARCDVYIFDILMPGVDGIRLGQIVRRDCPDVPILYTTSSRDFALDAFENHALRYLLKPIRQEELFSALDLARTIIQAQPPVLAVRGKDGTLVSLDMERILYVENAARTALYTMNDGAEVQTVCIRGTFDETLEPLPGNPDFLKPHKSFWVNMRYIRALQSDRLVMDNGTEIPVSRNRQAEVRRRYLAYLAEEGAPCP